MEVEGTFYSHHMDWRVTKGGPVIMGKFSHHVILLVWNVIASFTGYCIGYCKAFIGYLFHHITSVLPVFYPLRYEKLRAFRCMY